MSLNGLDTSAVVEAHQIALADPGGWFLLKYVSRDTVDVLSRGVAGVPEAKAAVERYEEKSPLFGMVQYRRKRVTLKFVPDGTSRLLQVRLTVQFQSILDAFPHDTVFSFTVASELVESALGMCTMLQPTAAGSSNSSVKQRRLNEITEDAEDVVVPVRRETDTFQPIETDTTMRTSGDSELSTLPASAIRAKALLAKRKEEREAESNFSTARLPRTDSLSPPPPMARPAEFDDFHSVNIEPTRPQTSLSHIEVREDPESIDTSLASALQPSEEPPKVYHHSRHLSENESEVISQWSAQVTAYTLPVQKPKKKLGPRPHVDTQAQTRPKTASPYDDGAPVRAVANLPQSVRVSTRPAASTYSRPASQQSTRSVPARYLPPTGLPPPLPEQSHLRSLYKPSEGRKGGSAISSAAESSNANPEKMRLMKALQQRKRNQILSQRAASAQPSLAIRQDDFPMRNHDSLDSQIHSPVPATIQEESASSSSEVKSLHAPSTASPTSIATTSEDRSTRPSSFAEECHSQSSRRSVSIETDSSSTPKALAETTRNSDPQKAVIQAHVHLNFSESDLPPNTDVPMIISTENVVRPTESDQGQSGLGVLQKLRDADASAEQAKQKHRPATNLVIPPSTEASSVFSDDDGLIEELQNATVQEAKPVSVIRQPLTPTMRTFSVSSRGLTKSGSNSSGSPRSSKTDSPNGDKSITSFSRSPSTALPAWPPHEEEPTAMPMTRNHTLADGISRRIKALEGVTKRESTATSPPSAWDTTIARGTFGSLMKRTSFISQFQQSTTSLDRSTSRESLKVPQATASGSERRTPRPLVLRQTSATELYSPAHKGETVSVTAQIVRDQNRPITSHTENVYEASVQFHRSPLIVEHARQDSDVSAPSTYYGAPASGMPSPALPSPLSDKRFSFTSHRSGSTVKFMQADSMASRLSLVSNKRTSKTSASETSSIREDKRASRTSRLMKRVSGLGSRFSGKTQSPPASKDGLQPDAIMEHPEAFLRPSSGTESVMQMIDIGYVNVQFPESLLWKRRFLRIDDGGYLLFTAPPETVNARGNNRKFHLADVQEPCLPDSERAEIAWSVLLDLRDGNCIQCACESKEAQTQVLKMLLDAHSAYHSLYPDALQ